MLVAHFLFRLHAFAHGVDGVAEPAHSFQMHGAALLHEVGHDVGQGAQHGVGVGGRHGALAGDAVGQFLRLHGQSHGDAARIPQVVDRLLYTFPKNHDISGFRSFCPSIIGRGCNRLIFRRSSLNPHEGLVKPSRPPR